VALYDGLMRLTPTPIIALNHAVANAMAYGPVHGLRFLEHPTLWEPLHAYYLYHAARADLLRRMGHRAETHAAYAQAFQICQNQIEQAYLRRRLNETAPEGDLEP
jgi:RNA polymerase sigma-70 factor (ECF subfamily)